MQIQPRPGEHRDCYHLFKCVAIQGEASTKEMFDRYGGRADRTYAEFGIADDPAAGGWRIAPVALPIGGDVLLQRITEALPELEVIEPAQMFTANCLICGKGLTDPASMARWIGPECAGTASLDAGLHTPKAATGPQPTPKATPIAAACARQS